MGPLGTTTQRNLQKFNFSKMLGSCFRNQSSLRDQTTHSYTWPHWTQERQTLWESVCNGLFSPTCHLPCVYPFLFPSYWASNAQKQQSTIPIRNLRESSSHSCFLQEKKQRQNPNMLSSGKVSCSIGKNESCVRAAHTQLRFQGRLSLIVHHGILQCKQHTSKPLFQATYNQKLKNGGRGEAMQIGKNMHSVQWQIWASFSMQTPHGKSVIIKGGLPTCSSSAMRHVRARKG